MYHFQCWEKVSSLIKKAKISRRMSHMNSNNSEAGFV